MMGACGDGFWLGARAFGLDLFRLALRSLSFVRAASRSSIPVEVESGRQLTRER